MKSFSVFSLICLCSILMVFSCNQKSNDLEDVGESTSIDFLKILSEKGWVEIDPGSNSERANYCQLGDATPFPCNGGSCEGSTSIEGHDFCVVCVGGENDGDMGCAGSGYVIIILNEILIHEPLQEVFFEIDDENGDLVLSGNGPLVDKITIIENALQSYSDSVARVYLFQ